jgi:cobalt-zinc-cadmium efflux system protein
LDVAELERELIRAVPSLGNVHHVHVWSLTQQHLMLTMHVTLQGDCADSTEAVRATKQVLRDTYGITHSTIEVDTSGCSDEEPVPRGRSAESGGCEA